MTTELAASIPGVRREDHSQSNQLHQLNPVRVTSASPGLHHRTSSSVQFHRSATKCYKLMLIATNTIFVMVCVAMVVFCIIRFVLPIQFKSSSENFMIFMIPSSLTQASIAAAGLLAAFSGLSWPLICYALVLIIPLGASLYWIYVRFAELQSLEASALPMFVLLIVCCVTWTAQMVCSLALSWEIKARNRMRKEQFASECPGHDPLDFDQASYLFAE